MGYLSGRVALVTGAGGGIGAAVARAFAAEDATVVVNDLGVALDGTPTDSAAAQSVAESITASGGRATADGTDVTDFDGVGALVERTVRTFGKLDVVVHSAGILRDRMVFNMSPTEWTAVLRVHLDGLFNLTRHVSAYWRGLNDPAGRYRLIPFTSRSGLNGAPGHANYAAAKMGVVGFTYSCARALARYGVTTTAVCPTADTRMTATQPAERRAYEPGSAEGSPDNVARVVTYIAGYDSDWLNGQVVGASGFEVSLYSKPVVAHAVARDAPWDLPSLAAALDASIRPHVEATGAARPPAGGSS